MNSNFPITQVQTLSSMALKIVASLSSFTISPYGAFIGVSEPKPRTGNIIAPLLKLSVLQGTQCFETSTVQGNPFFCKILIFPSFS